MPTSLMTLLQLGLGQAILWEVFLQISKQLQGQRTYLRPAGAFLGNTYSERHQGGSHAIAIKGQKCVPHSVLGSLGHLVIRSELVSVPDWGGLSTIRAFDNVLVSLPRDVDGVLSSDSHRICLCNLIWVQLV